MALFKKDEQPVVEEYDGVLNISEGDQLILANKKTQKANFKGRVEQNKINFPVELGVEHPFNFATTEGIFKKHGFTNGVVNKYIDYIVSGGYYVKTDNEEADLVIEKFFKDVNFDTILRDWLKEALTKNGFLEIGGAKDEVPQGLKVLDAKWMYVDRDKKGVIKGYNQYVGGFDTFSKKKIIPFQPYQVAHLKLNGIGNDAYGLGIVYPALADVENALSSKKNIHLIMKKKANSPYHVKLGSVVGGKLYKPSKATVDKWGGDLEWLNNKQEWVTDGLTEIKTVDTGNLGEKFDTILQFDTEQLLYVYQIPSVLMGTANINEGIADTQMDGFMMRIASLQQEVEKVIEVNILRRVLDANGFEDVAVEFEWGQPTAKEKNERMMKIGELLKSPMTSDTLKGMIELDLIKMLGYDEDEYTTAKEVEDAKKEKEKQEEKDIAKAATKVAVPGVVPTKAVKQCYENIHNHYTEEGLSKYKTIEQWLGFKFDKHKESIIAYLSKYKFDLLAATSGLEESAGMLTGGQVNALRGVLQKGFKEGRSIATITRDIKKSVNPKDLLKIENGAIVRDGGVPKVVVDSNRRAEMIARTEVSRAGNAGAIKDYKKSGVKKVRWIAVNDNRTCPICDPLDEQVYAISDHPALPQHVACRCTVTPITELG